MHEVMTERIARLQTDRAEDHRDFEGIQDCVQDISVRLARIETRVGMWAALGGVIGAAVAAAAMKLMMG